MSDEETNIRLHVRLHTSFQFHRIQKYICSTRKLYFYQKQHICPHEMSPHTRRGAFFRSQKISLRIGFPGTMISGPLYHFELLQMREHIQCEKHVTFVENQIPVQMICVPLCCDVVKITYGGIYHGVGYPIFD